MCTCLCPGLAISAVLKFADNIARVYAHAVAMLATMALSVQLFALPVTPQLVIGMCARTCSRRAVTASICHVHGLQVTPQLVIGMVLVANSTFQYHKVPYLPAASVPPPPGVSELVVGRLLEASDASDGASAVSELEVGRLARQPLQPRGEGT